MSITVTRKDGTQWHTKEALTVDESSGSLFIADKMGNPLAIFAPGAWIEMTRG
jgi:hypothetical protein